MAKGVIWATHGVLVVWLIDPETRAFLEMRPNAHPVPLGPGGTASAAPALPQFGVPVDDLFRPLAPALPQAP